MLCERPIVGQNPRIIFLCPRNVAKSQRSSVVRSSSNGAHSNGVAFDRVNGFSEKGKDQTIEMYVSSMDDLDDLDPPNPNPSASPSASAPSLRRRKSVHVSRPRTVPPQQLSKIRSSSSALEQADKAEAKSVKAELSVTKAELKAKAEELRKSQHSLRAREGEVALLRAALAGRDINLRDTRGTLLEVQQSLKDKENQLQGMYQQLMSGAKERGAIRQQVLDLQNELSESRLELANWVQHAGDTSQEQGLEGSAPAVQPAASPDETLAEMLSNLNRLSREIADDALADEAAFSDVRSL